MFFFSFTLSKKKIKTKGQPDKKITKASLHIHTHKSKKCQHNKKNVESILCWPTSPSHEDCPGLWLVHPLTLHWRKLICPFPAGVDCQMLLVKSGTVCLLLLLWSGIFSGLNLCRVCSCYTCLCESTCVLVLLCLEDTIFLELSTASTSYNVCHVDP